MTTDVFSPEKRSAVMRRVKGRDTSPELAVRRVLRAAGIGYRLGGQGLAGRPDLTMKGRRVAVFVHGCFWHGHDCPRGSRKPKANADYWGGKIARNRARDARSAETLTADGWRVVIVWECDLRTPDFAARLVAEIKGQAASTSEVEG
ncbi:MAG: very short patch repair endonuclease [Pseudomonadota bacterium]|jgi:DNA mismatch endonuclease (patch repair protein)|uniref:Very short patch repair endonuclease n=2 Tax=Brevundimonas TaxID=41275 RepID=A0A7W9F7F2_9CAUL|nr:MULTISPECIES: very short patch repair endonuclease [Brevundimonas]MEC8456402.1 very short patch repair endonuclease [Pseudomonadota bacterium]ALJ09726.1 Fis family transcriptional regulator [Brevundimonas sp. DS20]MBB5738865.1 DNA mismatch endonuclease (patch repair protein) [Brevundimonas aurantiaca]MEC8533313.1 very short patch repair endonuclease [Pseudomonadota bacterium]QFU33060.1 Very short patch repair protein [Brevundimonas sp. Bb-A]